MKTFVLKILLTIAFVLSALLPAKAFETIAPYAVVMHVDTGRIVFAKQADIAFPPASMSKLVTAAVTFEKLQSGEIKPATLYKVSTNAWRTGGAPAGNSTMFAEVRSEISVENLLKGLIVQSGNDAAIALAEGISGTEADFTNEMSAYMTRLGSTTASFGNASGLPNDKQLMSATDLAKVGRDIWLNHPEQFKLFALPEFTWNNIRQTNRNPVLGTINGVNGMKTGFTDASGYGVVISAERGDVRFVMVLGGLPDVAARADEAERLVDWVFNSFTARLLLKQDSIVGQARVIDGDTRHVDLQTARDVAPIMAVTNMEKIHGRIFYQGPLNAPLSKGSEVAQLKVYAGTELIDQVPLLLAANVARGNLAQRAKSGAFEMMLGLLPSFSPEPEGQQ